MTRVSRALTVGVCVFAGCLASGMALAGPIAGGGRHTVVVKPDGTVWAWGLNADGQLGDGTQTSRSVPAQVSGLTDVVAVATGWNHSLALKSDGTVWAWGANDRTQLGDGTTTPRLTPVQVTGLSGTVIVEIAAGADHAVARDSSNNVWLWGYNSTGQMGNGTWTNASTAFSNASFSPASAIAGGIGHTLVVKTDGTVWGAGYNLNGQLGDNSTTFRNTPVQMSGITTAVAVAGGLEHSLVVLSDGTVRACGWNFYGQVGDNTTTHRLTPVAVSGLTNVASVSAGWWHSQARTTDGTVYTWGYNGEGEVGNGTTSSQTLVPTAYTTSTGLTGAVLLATGFNYSIAVDANEVVWTWGWNTTGMLGDGTTTTRTSPVAISGPDYAWLVSTPIFSVPAGTYHNNQTVVITTTTPGTTIHYALDGNEPTESDPSIASGGNVVIDRTRTLKAKAFKAGFAPSNTTTAVYTMVVATPGFSPSPSTFTTPQTVTITTATSSATIYYTTDGGTPTTSSAAYTAPLSIGTTTVLRAIGARTDWTSSSVAGGTYTMNFGTLAVPTLSHATGTYTSSVTVTITSIAGATIRYTTNGTTPLDTSPIYTAPLEFTTTTTLNARAFHPDYSASQVSSATYTIQAATPTFTPGAGTYAAGSTITVSTATAGATITYTMNGAEPTQNDPTIASGGTLVVAGMVLKAKAWKTGCTPSGVVTATYGVTGSSAVPMIEGGMNSLAALKPDGTVWTWGGVFLNPTMPALIGGMTGVTRLSTGDSHILAVRADGTAMGWGANGGRLGDGTTTDRWTPVTVSGLTNVTAVSAGATHSLGVKADGTLWAWGSNDAGQLGIGPTPTSTLSPVAVTALTNVVGAAAGDRFSIALKNDGTVWTWGVPWNGILGDGSSSFRDTPGQVTGLTGVSAIAAHNTRALALKSDGTVVGWGFFLGNTPTVQSGVSNVTAIAIGGVHQLALTSDGRVWSWGQSGVGQLGHGNTTTNWTPTMIAGLTNVIAIGASQATSYAIDGDFVVWTWGENTFGAIGDGTITHRLVPTAISGPGMAWKVRTPTLSVNSGTYSVPQSVVVTCGELDLLPTMHYTTTGVDPTEADATVACGGTVSVTASLTLKVRGWREGAPPSIIASRTYELKAVTPTLLPVSGTYATAQTITLAATTSGATIRYTLDGSDPTDASTAYSGTFSLVGAVTLRARAFKSGWTPSNIVQESYWIDEGTVQAPVAAPAGGTYTSAPWVSLTSATPGAAIRYTTDGTTPTAQSTTYRYAFVVPVTTTIKAQAFKAGFAPSAVTTATFTLDVAGTVNTPTITPAGGTFTTARTVTIAGPVGATLHYTTNGADPTESDPTITSGGTVVVDRSMPVKVKAWQSGSTPSAVRRADFQITGALAAGWQHSLALKADGTLWAWGRNNEGQLGDGTNVNRLSPVQVLTNVVAIAAGNAHSLAVKADGTVWAWGLNDHRQLGAGTWDFSRNSPAQVTGLTNVTAVAAGAWHSLALKADGTVWAWGHGADGQIGNNSFEQQGAPVRVMGVPHVVRIAAAEHTSYAIDGGGGATGTLWAWGMSGWGQIGDGMQQSRYVPVRVAGLTSPVADVSAGKQWAAAILADGGVRMWGFNANTQLAGASGATFEPLPMASPFFTRGAAVALGGRHGLLLGAQDGRVWTWGSNDFGQGAESSFPFNVTSPHPLLPVSGLTAAGLGDSHSVIADAKGDVWVVGHNGSGQLGDGTSTPQFTNVLHKLTGFTLADNTWLAGDTDGDGLPTWREFLAHTDPLNPDTNGNGIPDGAELDAGRVADDPDADGDDSPNWQEAQRGTDPFRADSDGDGVNDKADLFPLDPTRSALPPPDPNDHTPPVITLVEPTNAIPIP